MQSKMLCLKLVFAVIALFHHVTAQSVTLSSSEGINLQERSDPYQVCVDLSASPSGSDLTVSISSTGSANSPEDFQLSNNMLTFVDGTSELQQCIDLMVVDDNLLEQNEFITLTATASTSTGTTDTQNLILFISNNDNALIGLDQDSYIVNEADASVTVCVVFLMNSGIQDPALTLTAEATISATDGTAIAVEDYGQPLPSSITLTSTTPASGACSSINIPQDAIIEGRETFSVTVTAGARSQIVDGRGTAQVVIVDSCGPLPPPENGNVDASITTIGSVATYSCNNGFLISGVSQRICQTDGFWSESAPSCFIVSCEVLTDPSSGTVSVNDTSRIPGTLATYTCNAGYLLSGESERNCQESGMWSGAVPICTRVCESLSNPTNGGVVINDSTRVVGSIATYSCDDGFLLSGSIERECQDNGMWSGNEPLCIGRTRVCESLNDPTNGEVVINDSSRVVGSIATYNCDDGFLLSGSIERECQDNGMWSGNEPLCIGRTRVCESLNDPTNGEVVINDSSRVVGSIASYNCDGGFFLSGNIERECQDNGTWSGDEPRCIEGPSTGSVSNQNRNIGIGVGVGVGGFLLILLVVIVIAVLILALKKRNTEKYVLNYSTVYGKGSGVGSTGNDYSLAPSNVQDGGESGSNGVQERGVDVGEDEGGEETSAITFKEE